jgi:hypothetical protein
LSSYDSADIPALAAAQQKAWAEFDRTAVTNACDVIVQAFDRAVAKASDGVDSAKLEPPYQLLEYALHLRQYGENAPGGSETWAEFDRRAEMMLRARQAYAELTPSERVTLEKLQGLRSWPRLEDPPPPDVRQVSTSGGVLWKRLDDEGHYWASTGWSNGVSWAQLLAWGPVTEVRG